MALPPDVTDTPPCAAYVYTANLAAGSNQAGQASGSSASAAYAAAVALLGSYDGTYGVGGATTIFNGMTAGTDVISGKLVYTATAARVRYGFYGYSATCYLSVTWDEVITQTITTSTFTASTGVTTVQSATKEYGRTSRTWLLMPPSINGYCMLKEGPTAITTVDSKFPRSPFASPTYDFTLPDPDFDTGSNQTVATNYTGNVVLTGYSCLSGYTAPTDNSANGFPTVSSASGGRL